MYCCLQMLQKATNKTRFIDQHYIWIEANNTSGYALITSAVHIWQHLFHICRRRKNKLSNGKNLSAGRHRMRIFLGVVGDLQFMFGDLTPYLWSHRKGRRERVLDSFSLRWVQLAWGRWPRLRAEREECLCSTFNRQMSHSLKNQDLESREWGREREKRERSCASCYSTRRRERGRSREREEMDRGMSEL